MLLLNEGASPNTCPKGGTALTCAVDIAHSEIVFALLKAGADAKRSFGKDVGSMELIHEENSSGSYYIDVSFENGGLGFSGQDFGSSVGDSWGSDEYEYWYRFDRSQADALWSLLGCAGASQAEKLAVLKARVHDLHSFIELRELCDKNGINYGFFSYCH